MTITTIAALLYTIITVGVVIFQMALALGAPWGAYAMGGAFPGRFPPAMRVAAVVQAFLLAAMAGVVLARAGLALPGWASVATWLIWFVVAFAVVATILNSITPSAGERRLWAPIALVMLASSLTVALTAG
jgi:hypothetical protein